MNYIREMGDTAPGLGGQGCRVPRASGWTAPHGGDGTAGGWTPGKGRNPALHGGEQEQACCNQFVMSVN